MRVWRGGGLLVMVVGPVLAARPAVGGGGGGVGGGERDIYSTGAPKQGGVEWPHTVFDVCSKAVARVAYGGYGDGGVWAVLLAVTSALRLQKAGSSRGSCT
jgi:hypothetical protein